MKFAAKNLLPLIALAVTFAVAQNNNIKQVQHVIVVIGKLCGTTATSNVSVPAGAFLIDCPVPNR